MLTIFRRHLKSCPHTSRRSRRCGCPIQVDGSLGGEKVRRALDLVSWEAASNLIHEWNTAGRIGGAVRKLMLAREAVELFIADGKSRHLADETLRIYRKFIERKFLNWCDDKGIRYLRELTFEHMLAFRGSWSYAAITASKRLEVLRLFFRFCLAADWIEKSPVAGIKAPQVDSPPTLPFTNEELQRVYAACDGYSTNGNHGRNRPWRVKAFVWTLRYSGLRIGDVVTLETTRLQGDNLLLYTAKTGTPVFVPLPGFVADALRIQAVRNPNPKYFFWAGVGKVRSGVSAWQRSLQVVFEKASVEGGHAHRFRDTFAVSLLQEGVPLDDVSILLGHSSTDITKKHYAPWVKSWQERLTERVRQTWDRDRGSVGIAQGTGALVGRRGSNSHKPSRAQYVLEIRCPAKSRNLKLVPWGYV
jgi:integrase/recombinase XerD